MYKGWLLNDGLMKHIEKYAWRVKYKIYVKLKNKTIMKNFIQINRAL